MIMAAIELSIDDQEFLAKCEEELQHRFTDKDEEYMKVLNAEPSIPPIIDPWWVSQNAGRRNDRRFNRRSQPYERRDRNHDRRDYNDRRSHSDANRESYGQRHHRSRY